MAQTRTRLQEQQLREEDGETEGTQATSSGADGITVPKIRKTGGGIGKFVPLRAADFYLNGEPAPRRRPAPMSAGRKKSYPVHPVSPRQELPDSQCLEEEEEQEEGEEEEVEYEDQEDELGEGEEEVEEVEEDDGLTTEAINLGSRRNAALTDDEEASLLRKDRQRARSSQYADMSGTPRAGGSKGKRATSMGGSVAKKGKRPCPQGFARVRPSVARAGAAQAGALLSPQGKQSMARLRRLYDKNLISHSAAVRIATAKGKTSVRPTTFLKLPGFGGGMGEWYVGGAVSTYQSTRYHRVCIAKGYKPRDATDPNEREYFSLDLPLTVVPKILEHMLAVAIYDEKVREEILGQMFQDADFLELIALLQEKAVLKADRMLAADAADARRDQTMSEGEDR